MDETGDAFGLFTGYYEASLSGSRTPSRQFSTPLHARPDDLVMVQLGGFREDLRGRRIAGRVLDGNLRPYEDRAEIVAGALDDSVPAIAWVDDPIAAFFLQIQGSGRMLLDDGSEMRVGYAGQNGHPYVPIGRVLINEGELSRETVSLQTIRAWLKANPDQADRVMNTNPSYVFFREIYGPGTLGGDGLPLTAGRSVAIDGSLLPFGAPMFLEATDPL
ncbi:MAG: MltA domain-containing protein, partial [Pseudomonadota bacterium]